jgi:hypothetical protein
MRRAACRQDEVRTAVITCAEAIECDEDTAAAVAPPEADHRNHAFRINRDIRSAAPTCFSLQSPVEILVFDPQRQIDAAAQKPISPFVDALGSEAMNTEVKIIKSKSVTLRVSNPQPAHDAPRRTVALR